MDKIDVEALISLVEERPVIWDRTLEIYKNKMLRDAAWKQIYVILKDDYEDQDKREMQEFGKAVTKKWTQLRDSWSKDIKRNHEKRPYKYYEKMSFLWKVFDTTVGQGIDNTNESGEPSRAEVWIENTYEETEVFERDVRIKKESFLEDLVRENAMLKRKRNEADDQIMRSLDCLREQKNDDPIFLFFKSISPVTTTLNVDESLEFQVGVIKLLQNIKRQRQST